MRTVQYTYCEEKPCATERDAVHGQFLLVSTPGYTYSFQNKKRKIYDWIGCRGNTKMRLSVTEANKSSMQSRTNYPGYPNYLAPKLDRNGVGEFIDKYLWDSTAQSTTPKTSTLSYPNALSINHRK